MKLALLLVILMLCPTFAGQQSQDNLPDEQFEALLIKLLIPMQNGIEPEFEDETEMTWRCTLDGVIDRPDQVYKQSYFKGRITPPDSRWYRQPSPIKDGVVGQGYGKSTPVDLIISGRKVKTVRYEWTLSRKRNRNMVSSTAGRTI